MTVKELIDQLQFLVKNKYILEDDVILLIGTGDIKSDYIQSVVVPQVTPLDYTPIGKRTGYAHIGFCSSKV